MSFYEISDEDIDTVVRYMKIFHPEKASREYAKAMLEYCKADFHNMSLTDPKALDDLFERYEATKNTAI
jgi:hypothetical protein